MASSISATLTGRREIERFMGSFNKTLFDQAALAISAATLDAATFSKTLTPVKTGYLRTRTQTRGGKVSNSYVLYAFYNDAPYALFVCFGTRYVPARDFMTPAYQYGKQRLVARLAQMSVG